jgi:hypothetical protein
LRSKPNQEEGSASHQGSFLKGDMIRKTIGKVSRQMIIAGERSVIRWSSSKDDVRTKLKIGCERVSNLLELID